MMGVLYNAGNDIPDELGSPVKWALKCRTSHISKPT